MPGFRHKQTKEIIWKIIQVIAGKIEKSERRKNHEEKIEKVVVGEVIQKPRNWTKVQGRILWWNCSTSRQICYDRRSSPAFRGLVGDTVIKGASGFIERLVYGDHAPYRRTQL
jgi:hypothetical protein